MSNPHPHEFEQVAPYEWPGILAAHEAYLARRPGGRRANLKFRDLTGFDLSGCQLAEVDLSGSCLRECRIVRTNLRAANLFGADLSRVDLTEAMLADADMRGVAMNDARLIRTDLTRVDLREGMLMETYAGDIRQTHTVSATTMCRAEVIEARLERAKLSNSFLNQAVLRSSDLKQAVLVRANLTKADLRGCNMRGANLTGANLAGASLEGVILIGATISSTNFEGPASSALCWTNWTLHPHGRAAAFRARQTVWLRCCQRMPHGHKAADRRVTAPNWSRQTLPDSTCTESISARPCCVARSSGAPT